MCVRKDIALCGKFRGSRLSSQPQVGGAVCAHLSRSIFRPAETSTRRPSPCILEGLGRPIPHRKPQCARHRPPLHGIFGGFAKSPVAEALDDLTIGYPIEGGVFYAPPWYRIRHRCTGQLRQGPRCIQIWMHLFRRFALCSPPVAYHRKPAPTADRRNIGPRRAYCRPFAMSQEVAV